MTSCQCQGIDREFSAQYAARDLASYRRKGASRTTRMLTDALIAEGVEGGTLLDIGGGVGAIGHILLTSGMRSATGVEASSAYAAAAVQESRQRGLADRMEQLQGDFVEVAPQVAEHDVVTLDRVICCYDDLEGLVRASATKARRLYGLVFPRETWWIRLGMRLLNAGMRLRGSSYRSYAHSTEKLERLLEDMGLKLSSAGRTALWQVRVYAR
jgi:magnesium-protoporphyrin O-methyltransferase